MKTYTTVQGDMWDSIAHRQMGSTDYTDIIMNANHRHTELFNNRANTECKSVTTHL